MLKFMLRKFLCAVLLSATVISVSACFAEEEEEKANVGFMNESDINILYGIKYGEAAWNQFLYAGDDTWEEWGDGVEVTPGSYYVQIKNASGVWENASTSKLGPVEAGGYYDILFGGTSSTGYYFELVVWEKKKSVNSSNDILENVKYERVVIKRIMVNIQK